MKQADIDRHTPAHTHLQHFTLIDKQHTQTPTHQRINSLLWSFQHSTFLACVLFSLSVSLICLYHPASSTPPTSIIVHMVNLRLALKCQNLAYRCHNSTVDLNVCACVCAQISDIIPEVSCLHPFRLY